MFALFVPFLTTPPLTDDSVAGLLHRSDVQAELKMTKSQVEKWEAIDRIRAPKRGGTFEQDPVVLTDPAEQEKKDAEREKKAWSVIGPDQSVRLRELFLQRQGVRALSRDDVQWTLELTDPQKGDVRRAKTKRDMALRTLLDQSKRAKLDPKRVRDVLDAVDKQFIDDLNVVLTSEQADKLAQAGGRPFIFNDRR